MACRAQDRLPHAFLLGGPAGIGKRIFAATLIQALACARPREGGRGCGTCTGCRLQHAGSHPDHMVLLPMEGKQAISIDQIRQVQAHLALKARQSRFKTVAIFSAEAMTLNAADSLLKVLEEPPGETIILLITSTPAKLPVTVRSRCQRLWLTLPKPCEAEVWVKERLSADVNTEPATLLALAGGAPFRALECAEQRLSTHRKSFIEEAFSLARGASEPLAVAQNWLKNDAEEPLYWMSTLVEDMIRLKCGVPVQYLVNRDRVEFLHLFIQNISLNKLFALLEKINSEWRLRKGRVNVNSQLLLEGLLIQWSLCFQEVNYGRD